MALALLAIATRQAAPVSASPLSPRAIAAVQINAVVEQPALATVVVATPARIIVVHTGDTIESLARTNGADLAATRWANGLPIGAEPSAGSTLLLPPAKGALVAVRPGETPTQFATRIGIDPAVVLDYNALTSNAPLPAGSYLQVPLSAAPVGSLISSLFEASETRFVPRVFEDHGSDGFPYGQCTYYVATRRNVTWGGNAWTWWFAAAGIRPEGHVPVEGAIAVFRGGWAGHVAYVEHVNPDGSFIVSEMNYYADGGGWGRVDHRLVSGDDAWLMGFIY
ncbi:MAG: CHAP domain-containing protein [Candidatus Dormibacteraeota bacterium]|nr:CHAP domain-containing protein [Candidatus Dormibacteraeota bacterium]